MVFYTVVDEWSGVFVFDLVGIAQACTHCPMFAFYVIGANYCQSDLKMARWANYGFACEFLFVLV
jgi:hypothetical protein